MPFMNVASISCMKAVVPHIICKYPSSYGPSTTIWCVQCNNISMGIVLQGTKLFSIFSIHRLPQVSELNRVKWHVIHYNNCTFYCRMTDNPVKTPKFIKLCFWAPEQKGNMVCAKLYWRPMACTKTITVQIKPLKKMETTVRLCWICHTIQVYIYIVNGNGNCSVS